MSNPALDVLVKVVPLFFTCVITVANDLFFRSGHSGDGDDTAREGERRRAGPDRWLRNRYKDHRHGVAGTENSTRLRDHPHCTQ